VPLRASDRYEGSAGSTDYIEFEGRPHLMMVGEGWEAVAGGIVNWLNGVLAVSTVHAEGASA
jgi:hypothetical protein